MTPRKSKTQQGRERLSELPAGDQEFMKSAVREALEEVLAAEMEQALGAAKSERSSERLGYRSGYYRRAADHTHWQARVAGAARSARAIPDRGFRALSA